MGKQWAAVTVRRRLTVLTRGVFRAWDASGLRGGLRGASGGGVGGISVWQAARAGVPSGKGGKGGGWVRNGTG